MNASYKDHCLTLRDGRTLSYRFHGNPAGLPLFFFHGTPGSRWVLAADDALVQHPDMCIIVPERPGYGLSTLHANRSLLSWAADIGELADSMGLDQFAVAGISGGGPHALACAWLLPERVTTALLLASPSPATREHMRGMALSNRLGIVLAKRAPWLLRWIFQRYARAFERAPEAFLDAIARSMCAADRSLLEKPALRAAMLADLQAAYAQGSHGQFADSRITMADWGFALSQIRVPVVLWHGTADTLVPLTMAQQLAAAIPSSTLHIVPDAGHLLTEDATVVAQYNALTKSIVLCPE